MHLGITDCRFHIPHVNLLKAFISALYLIW